MRKHLRVIALVLATTIAVSACTPGEVALFLELTEPTRDVLSADELYRLRQCESTDNYEAINPSGTYRGAYQFDQTTWNDVASRHFPFLADRDPATVEPWWQDSMTRALWSERGRQPWPVCGLKV